MGRDRLLVIDASLPKRLAPDLKKRSREAVSAAELGLADVKDPDLLRSLAERYNGKREWVLVTGDDAMPAEHGSVIHETAATLATIHPEYPADLTQHAWQIDVVHRWAHAIQEQAAQTVRRYALNGSQVWRPRHRHRRQIREQGWNAWKPGIAATETRTEAVPQSPPLAAEPERLPGLE